MKRLLVILILSLMLSVQGQEYERNIEDYNLETLYSEVYTDCMACVMHNPELLFDNDTVFAYSILRNKVKCQNYQDYMLTRALGDIWQHRAYVVGQCIGIAEQILTDSESSYLGLDFFQGVNIGADRMGVFGFLYAAVKGFAGEICFEAFCFDFFFNIMEGIFGVFEIVFGVIWFFISNLYIALIVVEMFIVGQVILTVGLMPKVRVLVSWNIAALMFIWNFTLSLIRLFITVVNMIRGMIPFV